MSKTVRTFLSGASFALGATVAFSGTAQANTELLDQINSYSQDDIAQVNSVFQLSDVSPSDWAFDALRNLVENYNCIVGYPDGTFRGSRPLSRYEFAAGLNACLQQIERMIQSGGSEVTPEDLAALRRLVNEFEAELATLGARVDDLEGRVEFLEDHQFSTTTKLGGEVIFNLGAAFGEDNIDDQVTFSDRVRLNLDTSFTGKDRLRTRLEAGNITAFDDATGVDTARLGFDTDNDNDVEIGKLYYRFPLSDNIRAYVGAVGMGLDDIADSTSPYFESSGSGALSRFGRFNPIYRGPDGAGAGFNLGLGEKFTFTAAYLADDGDVNNPEEKNGLFNGNYTAAAQLDFEPSDNIMLSAVYARRYQKSGDVNLTGSTGSDVAKDPWDDGGFGEYAASSDNFGLQASWLIGEKFNLGGWVGYTNADIEDPTVTGNAEVWNWAVNAALLDVGGEGNVLGLIFGQPPKLTNADIDFGGGQGSSFDDEGETTYLAELQYRYKLNKNITITPGAYVIFNPNQNDDNDTVVVGSVRTTFSF
ncbi:S-layer protein [Picosynechococcus sp. PCC 7003]|uniref:iron uptake porin n=1 Tax=Picosynechococcus sp. PCC 7003 TaxID=374981 RepID=UPI0008104881|nr:iron uptake porin [Picosynechococcus sp. PCC 7003]ANV83696.1 S-layer protein [Picosynechococcus sp. PCC 7003]